MTLFRMNDVDYENMTMEGVEKIFSINLKSYYKKHFQNNKNVEEEVYKLSKRFFLDIWNTYFMHVYLVYCLGNYQKTTLYLNEIPEETKNKIDFFFKNFDESLCLYEAIFDRLLEVSEKFDKKLKQFTPQ